MPLRALLTGDARGGGGRTALRASVLEHLRDMCRTRRGTVEGRPDYGLPDVSEMVHSFPRAITDMRDALLHTIETYETRLRNVRVTHIPSKALELAMRFEIAASLVDEDGDGAVRFETHVDGSRGVRVD